MIFFTILKLRHKGYEEQLMKARDIKEYFRKSNASEYPKVFIFSKLKDTSGFHTTQFQYSEKYLCGRVTKNLTPHRMH